MFFLEVILIMLDHVHFKASIILLKFSSCFFVVVFFKLLLKTETLSENFITSV